MTINIVLIICVIFLLIFWSSIYFRKKFALFIAKNTNVAKVIAIVCALILLILAILPLIILLI
jgi:hypothetical protein